MEVCVALGEIGSVEAHNLKAAGVTAYTHNLDTSPEFYPEIVSTHTFQNRLDTIAAVQESGLSVCCGGVVGLGGARAHPLRRAQELTNSYPPPAHVPLHYFMARPGTAPTELPALDNV